MTTTLAWVNPFQHRTNEFEGPGQTNAILEKHELDGYDGVTDIPVAGAQFLLFRVNEDGSSTQIGGIRLTGADGRIVIPNMLPGDYYFYEWQPAPGFTFALDEYGNEIRRFPFTIYADSPLGADAVVRAYNPRIRGGLILTKVVEMYDGSDELPDFLLEQEFEFRITFSDGGPHTFRINDAGDEYTVYSGDIITLRHGQSAVFRNIPVGVTYTVTELPVPGFDVSSSNHQGTITGDEDERIVLFTNTWLAEVGSLRVTKEVVGTMSDTEFEFTAVVGGVVHTFTLRHDEEWVLNNIPLGTEFTVTEAPTDGYIANIIYYKGVIAVRGVEVLLPFINVWDEDLEDEYGSLRITKEVPGGSDTEFSFTVVIGGVEHTFTLRDGEYELFEDIPHGTAWSVVEHPAEGYIASIVTANGIIAGNVETVVNFVNHTEPEPPDDVEISITKIVEGNMPDPNQRFYFILEVEGQDPIEFYLTAGQVRTFTVPAGVMYTITEVMTDGFSLIHVEYGHGTTRYGILAEFTNRFDGMWTIDISGTKTWDNGGHTVTLPTSITVRLMNGDIIAAETVVTPDADGNWHFTFENLPKYDADGNEIVYTIVELPVEGWTPEYHGFDIVNRYTGYRHIDISVRKVWQDGNSPDRPTYVRVQLYRDGVAYGEPVTLNAANTWQHIWIRLDRGPVWTVDELNVPEGYTESISGSAETGFTITNRKDDIPPPPTGTVLIEGRKYWNHGRNPVSGQPDSITVIIFANGERYKSFLLTANDHWRFAFEVNKYDANGNVIVWTVDEEYVVDYDKSIDGHNITNTHISVRDPNWPGGTDRPDVDNPGTGDNRNFGLWITVMVISLLGLVTTFVAGKRSRRRHRYFGH